MAASKLLPLVRGTVLYRVYARRAGEPDRALSFYRDSDGRASPVLDASGKKDPALYAAVDSAQGATLEMLYHTVLKKFRKGAVLPRSIFKDLRLVKIAVKQTLKLVSIEALQAAGDVAPPVFSLPRADYSDTQAVAQALYSRYRTAAGLCWHSAQGPAVVAVLYESRMPTNALTTMEPSVELMSTAMDDYIAEVLAYHSIALQP